MSVGKVNGVVLSGRAYSDNTDRNRPAWRSLPTMNVDRTAMPRPPNTACDNASSSLSLRLPEMSP